MDFATLPSLSSSLSIAAPSLICMAFVWVIWRTESLHVLMHRLWQLVHGKQEITDPEVRAFIDEQTSLISFRLFAGVKVNSLAQARQLIQWAKRKDTEAFIKDSLKEQRWTCVLLIGFAIWLCWISFLAWATGYVAKHLAARRLDPSLPDSQLALDFGN